MINILTSHWSEFLNGFWNTILCSIIALFFSLILGVGFALLEVSPPKFGRIIARIYIEVFRNIPLLVITMVFYLVIPQFWVKISGFVAGTIGLTLYTSAFIAETVRSGINSVGEGQMEGARSNGMTYTQAMRYVILPQAMKIVIPPLGNQFVNLIKNSSVLAFDPQGQGRHGPQHRRRTRTQFLLYSLYDYHADLRSVGSDKRFCGNVDTERHIRHNCHNTVPTCKYGLTFYIFLVLSKIKQSAPRYTSRHYHITK